MLWQKLGTTVVVYKELTLAGVQDPLSNGMDVDGALGKAEPTPSTKPLH